MKRLFLVFILGFAVFTLSAQETEQEAEEQAKEQTTQNAQQETKIPENYEETTQTATQVEEAEESIKGLSDEKVQELMVDAKSFGAQELIISKSMSVRVQEEEMAMNQGVNNGIALTLSNASAKKAAAVWKSYAKSFKTKTKRVKGSDELLSDDARLLDVSDNSVDVYATFDDSGEGSVATIWFDLGGTYLNSQDHRQGFGSAVKMLEEYAAEVGKSVAEDQLKADEKTLKSLEKELSKLESNKSSYEKKIEDAKKMIAEMESNIKQNDVDQAKKNEEIEKQEEIVKKSEDRVKEF